MAQSDPRWEQLRAAFSAELDERVRELNRLLLQLEGGALGADARRETFNALFREAHSLKGAARAVELPAIEQLAHRLETALAAARQDTAEPAARWFDEMYRAVDALPAAYQTPQESAAADGDGPRLHKREADGATASAAGDPSALNGAASDGPPATTARPAASLRGRLAQTAPAGGLRPAAPATIEPGQPAPTGEPVRSQPGTAPGASVPASETVRVAVAKLDALLAQAGELAVTHTRIEQRLSELRALHEDFQNWRRAWRAVLGVRAAVRAALPTLGAANSRERHDLEALLRVLDQAEQHTQALGERVEDSFRQFRQDTAQLGLVSNEIGDVVMAVRLLPVATVFGPFERLVRDLARSTDKQVQLVLEGGDTEIDRKILDQLRDPLVHMLRNAVDHGLEAPADRLAQGKPAVGTIRLAAVQRGGAVEIELDDDGRGLDPARLRDSAVQKGLLSAEQAADLDDRAALELIFLPGFSTRTTVSETSGRGVGMDVVRQNVERLHGHVGIASRPGRGTRFTISVPLTLATTRAVLVEQGSQLYAIPASSVERSLRARPAERVRLEGHPTISVDGQPVPLVELAAVLEQPAAEAAAATDWHPFLVLRQGERQLALLVDRLAGEREIVVKSLGWPLRRVRNVSGAAILGSGQLVVILNPADLLKTGFKLIGAGVAPRLTPEPAPAGRERRRLLVVDDSLTTRTLERSILEGAGYDVSVAGDGAEALRLLRGGTIDLVISDVDMPVLDGFGLTAEIRRDERLKRIPVVLVTSLDAREHRERGVAAGADAYVVKSRFDQDQLLATISRLL